MMFGKITLRGNLPHSNFKKTQTSFFNQTTHTNAFPHSLIFSATKYLKIKNLSHRPFEKPYLEGSGFAEIPYLHQNSPYIHEFPSGIVPSVEIENLRDNPGSRKRKRIVGRGIGCRKGKTSGRGHKGQKSRSGGGTRPGFEGGVPFYKRVRKFGFSNAMFKQEYTELNLDRLQYFFDSGRLTVPVDRPLNIRDLKLAGVLPRIKNPVKLLGEGKTWFKGPKEGVLNIEVQATSKDARSCVEATGGKVTTVYFNKLGLTHFLKFPHEQIKIKFARCVKHPEKYDMPRFVPYDQRVDIEEEVEENFEEEEGEVEDQQQ